MEPNKCDLCQQQLKEGDDVTVISTGYLSRWDEDEQSFNPTGEEFMICDSCARSQLMPLFQQRKAS